MASENPTGRPREWTEDDASMLCDYMEGHGVSLNKAAAALSIPVVSAHRTLKTYPAQWARYRAILEGMGNVYEQDANDILESTHALILSLSPDDKRVNALASSARNLSELRRWRARVSDPERYGDKLNVNASVTTRSVVLLPPLASASEGTGTLASADARATLATPATPAIAPASDIEYSVSDDAPSR